MPILPQPPLSPPRSKVLGDHLAPLRPGRSRGPLAVGGRRQLQALKGAGIVWLPWALDGLGQGSIAPVTGSSGHGAIVGPVIRGSVGCYAAAATPQLHLCTAAASDAQPKGNRVWAPRVQCMISWHLTRWNWSHDCCPRGASCPQHLVLILVVRQGRPRSPEHHQELAAVEHRASLPRRFASFKVWQRCRCRMTCDPLSSIQSCACHQI